jgi:hypothetical protein
MPIKFICTICGKEILIKPCEINKRKTCGSKECVKKIFSQQRSGIGNPNYKPKVKKQCPICGKSFEESVIHSEKRVCCSHKCMGILRSKTYIGKASPVWIPKIKVNCLYCGKEIERLESILKLRKHGVFCSVICQRKWRSEKISQEKHWNWQGGITELYYSIRTCARYSRWRNAVYKRDNYCDWYSGVKGNKNTLVAHHNIPFMKILKKHNIKTFNEAIACAELWDLNNGMTMLKTTHNAHHAIWGRK